MVTKDQRRRQLAREKFERQQQRRVQLRHKSRMRNSIIAAVAVVVIAAVGGAWLGGAFDSSGKKTTAAAKGATPSASAAPTTPAAPVHDPCSKPAAGSPGKKQWKTEPTMSIDKSASYTFTLQTTCGAIPMALNAAKAPETVNSFKFLADQGFFDHTKCHRLTTTGIYVLQCGDPTGQGSGGPGYTIGDENLTAFGKAGASGSVTYPAGTVAMANTGQPHTGGSQFFLVYKDSPLAPSYTPFGTISKDGLKVLTKIAGAGEDSGQGDGHPNATVVINKATVTTS
ncbi:peptidyl-prolyl cis-trans isomerase B (cyclophilin B) [Streptomyces sp. DvalAA-14]|uniref:peptidylprolyl isomerase n=1 Tax=unclassified Streptomyces TaxID=2593676 RepID=UPI00081B4BE8|nr:peptidylprolyl isomerase [Streptomyces sp. DvalAA-14]MYS21987.1 peptidylprolyl isomerase [Streptomyces sp. SID4948]SCE06050.1 peptidyl-prolyl cis-trans isomerase B (cyclophilin B) [Streptomyces sp. DvalAA-14]